jgi:hypothetical protein
MTIDKLIHNMKRAKGIFLADYEDRPPKDRLFSDVYLYDDLKMLLSRMLISKESAH